MARHRYPLEALRKLRDERAEAQAHELAAQIARSRQAESALSERQRARQAHAQRTAEILRLERERLAAGQGSGADLLRVTEFEAGARARARLLESSEHEARQALSRELAAERKLREELARREADAELVRNHEADFHQRAASAAQRAEEEAGLEQWNARRR